MPSLKPLTVKWIKSEFHNHQYNSSAKTILYADKICEFSDA